MGRNSTYKKELCYNPQCINGGKAANHENPRCYLGRDEQKVFCTPECGQHYLENIKELEKESRIISKIKTRKSRRMDELTEAIYILSGKSFDKKIIRKVIEKLNLTSEWV